jgi:uncharacterized protein (TIGR03435 family)
MKCAARLLMIMACATPAVAQTTSLPSFEVASIKQRIPDSDSSTYRTTTGRLEMRNQTLKRCIQIAYALKAEQVSGGPEWIDSDRFDIDAKAEAPVTGQELMLMLQSLLKDRFKLLFHREMKSFPGYSLVVAKGGLKVHEVTAGLARTNTRRGSMVAEKMSLNGLARTLANILGVPVLDKTGIPGVFDMKLEWSPDDSVSPPPANGSGEAMSSGSLFTAVQEQLGIRLQSEKVPLDVLVIDAAERPDVK